MKKLYLVSQSFPPTAFSLKRYWYAQELQDAGFEVSVITAQQPVNGFEDPDYDDFKPNFEVIRLPIIHWGVWGKFISLTGLISDRESNWDWVVAKFLKSRLKREPGIVLVIYPPVSSLNGCLKVAKACRCPVVLDYREPFEPDASNIKQRNRLEGQLLSGADLISVATEEIRGHLLDSYNLDKGKVVVVHNGYAGPLPPAKITSFINTPLQCIYAGGITSREKPEIFCQAWRILFNSNPELAKQLRFTFYGLPTRYGEKHLLPLLVDGYLDFFGFVSAGALKRIITDTDLGLVSLADAKWGQHVPGRIFDYLANAKPIVAALPKGEANAIINNSGAGITVPFGDAVRLAEELAALLRKRDRLKQHAINALAIRGRILFREQIRSLALTILRRLS